MPIYEYECTSCGDKTEILQSINAEPLTYCSACGQDSLKKVIAPTSFILKGSGWYVTDYPSEDRKKAMESEKSATTTKTDKGAEKKEATTKEASKEAPKETSKETTQKSEPAQSKTAQN
jgi:putative FmdB family regulatory protein